jgi:hypothetical protein
MRIPKINLFAEGIKYNRLLAIMSLDINPIGIYFLFSDDVSVITARNEID